jgi:cytochrome c553/mono/diheme cytochrome c family protein
LCAKAFIFLRIPSPVWWLYIHLLQYALKQEAGIPIVAATPYAFARRSLAVVFTLATAFAQKPSDANGEFFEMRIRPLLVNRCYACHTEEHMGGLQLDTLEHALKGGKSGVVIKPGDPAHSLMVEALHYTNARLKMPPTGRLKDSEIADVETWIKNGALWPKVSKDAAPSAPAPYVITAEQRAFWSFRPITNPAPPAVRDKKWARSEIDRFILAKLEERNLRPVAPASKRSLIRRATYDLTGLPPTPAEVVAFENDPSPGAFAKVVDRLLESPRYGEKWGRFWLDIARYSDDRLNSERDDPYENSFRYRDWVIQAVQRDMPFNLFVKAQIAGDLLPHHELYEAGLGFYALSPEFQDERVDATTRGFMALTVACATCHNHKYDPIPAQDYYSLLGIFNNTELHETPLASKEQVETYESKKKELDAQEKEIKDFVDRQANELAEILAQNTASYMLGEGSHLDKETAARWAAYLALKDRKQPFLARWDAEKSPQAAHEFQTLLLAINAEKKRVDDENHIRLGLNPSRENLSDADLVSLARDKYVLWEQFFGDKGIYHYGDGAIDRFLPGVWKGHLDSLHARLAELKKELPPHYPYLQTIADKEKPSEQHVWLRGNKASPGELAPPHFLSILSSGPPARFSNARLDLAEAIVDPKNPLTSRVIVNRVWQQHFGQGIVRTPSNFGKQGDTPSHPELLDYLATRFMAEGWSLKKLHREMMLTSAYALSTQNDEADYAADPENRLLWHANRRRLDVESIRDSLLFVAGNLDLQAGGPAIAFGPGNHRRTVYGFVSRRRLDPVLALFDFPNPVVTSEQRLPTLVPLQKLFFMNSDFVMEQSKALAQKLLESKGDDDLRIVNAYRLLFQRDPTLAERKLALEFLSDSGNAWPRYAQVLLSSNEFSYLN